MASKGSRAAKGAGLFGGSGVAQRALAVAAQRREPLIVVAVGAGAGLITWILTRPMRRR